MNGVTRDCVGWTCSGGAGSSVTVVGVISVTSFSAGCLSGDGGNSG